jgi:tetratricopeptide (TPR) repeat protein
MNTNYEDAEQRRTTGCGLFASRKRKFGLVPELLPQPNDMKKNSSLLGTLLVVLAMLPAACSRTPAEREARFLQRGKDLVAKKDYSRAAIEFQNAAKIMPKDAEPVYQLALLALERRDLRSAIPLLNKATALNPHHAGAQLKLATLMLTSADPATVQAAGDRIAAVVAQAPADPEALDTLALSDLRMGKLDDALDHLRQALDKAPEHFRSALSLAKLQMSRNDLDGAEATLQKLNAAAPNSAPAMLALAEFYIAARKNGEAERQINRVLGVDPKNGSALRLLAAIQVEGGRVVEAEQTYLRLAQLPDNQYRPLHAVFLYRNGKADQAIAELEKLNRQDPADRGVRRILVGAYLEHGGLPKAQQLLADALKKNPKDVDAHRLRARLHLMQGKPAEAESDLNQVLHFEPNAADAHYYLASVYNLRGAPLRQRQELNQTLRLQPGLLAARTQLVRLMINQGEAQAASTLLDEAPSQQKGALPYLLARNWVLLALDRKDEVRKNLDAVLAQLRPLQFLYQDALLRVLLKDYSGAQASLKEILDRNPESGPSIDLLAGTFAAQGAPHRSLEVVRQYAYARPQSANLRFLLGLWLVKTGDREQARKAFLEAENISPDFVPARMARAELDLGDGKAADVLQSLAPVLASHPENTQVRSLLAAAEAKNGNTAAAIGHYRAIVASDSSDAGAWNNLAYYLAAENPAEAAGYARKALELRPNDATTQDTMGWVCYRKGEYSEAVRYFKDSVAKQSTPIRQFHLALAYAKTGEPVKARENMDAALKQDPKLAVTEAAWVAK